MASSPPFHGVPTMETFNGLRVYTVPEPAPRVQLSNKICVSDSFRCDFNLWLLDFFGRHPDIIPDGEIVVWEKENAMFMNHKTWSEFKRLTWEAR